MSRGATRRMLLVISQVAFGFQSCHTARTRSGYGLSVYSVLDIPACEDSLDTGRGGVGVCDNVSGFIKGKLAVQE